MGTLVVLLSCYTSDKEPQKDKVRSKEHFMVFTVTTVFKALCMQSAPLSPAGRNKWTTYSHQVAHCCALLCLFQHCHVDRVADSSRNHHRRESSNSPPLFYKPLKLTQQSLQSQLHALCDPSNTWNIPRPQPAPEAFGSSRPAAAGALRWSQNRDTGSFGGAKVVRQH